VKVFKANAALDHKGLNGSDFAFTGNVQVRNISFDFEVFSRE